MPYHEYAKLWKEPYIEFSGTKKFLFGQRKLYFMIRKTSGLNIFIESIIVSHICICAYSKLKSFGNYKVKIQWISCLNRQQFPLVTLDMGFLKSQGFMTPHFSMWIHGSKIISPVVGAQVTSFSFDLDKISFLGLSVHSS